jgi:hypothetical protein
LLNTKVKEPLPWDSTPLTSSPGIPMQGDQRLCFQSLGLTEELSEKHRDRGRELVSIEFTNQRGLEGIKLGAPVL